MCKEMAVGNLPPSAAPSIFADAVSRRSEIQRGFSVKKSHGNFARWPRNIAKMLPKLSGEHTARVTPVPIPNTEVKPRRADGTARVSVWEIR